MPGIIDSAPDCVTRVQEASADDMSRFVSQVLADTEDVWERVFKAAGRQYVKPRLVIFAGGTQTRCGTGLTAKGFSQLATDPAFAAIRALNLSESHVGPKAWAEVRADASEGAGDPTATTALRK